MQLLVRVGVVVLLLLLLLASVLPIQTLQKHGHRPRV